MSQRSASRPARQSDYWRQCLYPVHSLVLVAPLLLFFHAARAAADVDLAGPALIGRFLAYFGATQAFLPALLVVTVLAVQQALRRVPWRPDPAVLAGMVGEAILWTLPLVGVAMLTARLAPAGTEAAVGAVRETARAGAMPAAIPALGHAVAAVGAGVYEEFLFRLVAISLLGLLLADVAGLRRDVSIAAAVTVAALGFALCHFLAEPFRVSKFVFLTVAGLVWGGLYLTRGFAVAVGSHVCWNLYAYAMNGDG